jgi:hypothetical protein
MQAAVTDVLVEGALALRQGRVTDALRSLDQAVLIARRAGDRAREATARTTPLTGADPTDQPTTVSLHDSRAREIEFSAPTGAHDQNNGGRKVTRCTHAVAASAGGEQRQLERARCCQCLPRPPCAGCSPRRSLCRSWQA